MLSCKDLVKRLNSKEQATFFQRAEMRVHLMMCKHCSNYAKHLAYMRTNFKKLFSNIMKSDPEKVKGLEEKVIENFKKAGEQD